MDLHGHTHRVQGQVTVSGGGEKYEIRCRPVGTSTCTMTARNARLRMRTSQSTVDLSRDNERQSVFSQSF
ncbi:hypothetical protein J6590_102259 [Homalodisca vitripennis]|nr:hypothetical protein J6590_102259 [Homalodisca vitripennis]